MQESKPVLVVISGKDLAQELPKGTNATSLVEGNFYVPYSTSYPVETRDVIIHTIKAHKQDFDKSLWEFQPGSVGIGARTYVMLNAEQLDKMKESNRFEITQVQNFKEMRKALEAITPQELFFSPPDPEGMSR